MKQSREAERIIRSIRDSLESANVLKAVQVGRERGLLTIGMTGQGGGKLKDAVDFCICVPSDNTPRIQEAHILAGHILCEIIEKDLLCECNPS